jgi:hypothetical protein
VPPETLITDGTTGSEAAASTAIADTDSTRGNNPD